MIFQLTRPLRGATVTLILAMQEEVISTHTPLAGRDSKSYAAVLESGNVNSHAPCGARHVQPRTLI